MSIADRIIELEAILDAGGRAITTDGLKVEYDLAEVRRRLGELRAQNDPTARPRIGQVDLSGF